MKLEDATLSIERRSAAECIDLACVFWRRHAGGMLALAAAFGIPACLFVYLLEANLFWALVIFYGLSPFLGATVVGSSGPRVFGDPFSARTGLRSVGRNLPSILNSIVLTRIAISFWSAILVAPGLVAGVRYGFIAEVLLLEGLRGSRLVRRVRDLPSGVYSELAARLLATMAFFACAAVTIFVLLDLSSGILFGLPILIGRLSFDGWDTVGAAFDLLASDPVAVTALSAVLWLAYPLARMAWFFSYLDVRIRKEGWDVELDFRIEARRLESMRS